METNKKVFTFPRIAVFVSGSGTNLEAILSDDIDIALVLSDRPNIGALEIARNASVNSVVVDRSQYKGKRNDFTQEIIKHLKEQKIELIILAGFMTILSAELFETYENRVINIHPSLLPAFKGANAVENALDAGVQVTGCTVHIATANVDDGPILAQESVEIIPGDTPLTLHKRIQKIEHRIFPTAIRQFCLKNFNQVKGS